MMSSSCFYYIVTVQNHSIYLGNYIVSVARHCSQAPGIIVEYVLIVLIPHQQEPSYKTHPVCYGETRVFCFESGEHY